ncbi:hypothetical protein HRI_001486400 [Hibiscus trionum]|uniref:Uncharacterized protein n=1 Tax=Hibiscus trionum TaxID=183268 RepID=A0A9W7LW57_HIBTR|nr:hypothetical protein HRI_001486400 [Hibiscus trionum]
MESSRTVSEDNQTSNPSSSRIPAHVFAPTSTSSQAEWSTASNESLFSIHMGNTSFNESRELDYSPVMASPLFEFPVTSAATPKSREDAAATETMRDKESHQHKNVDKESDFGRSMSQLSDASGKSFAFPM